VKPHQDPSVWNEIARHILLGLVMIFGVATVIAMAIYLIYQMGG
jgi:hypothetical protein